MQPDNLNDIQSRSQPVLPHRGGVASSPGDKLARGLVEDIASKESGSSDNYRSYDSASDPGFRTESEKLLPARPTISHPTDTSSAKTRPSAVEQLQQYIGLKTGRQVEAEAQIKLLAHEAVKALRRAGNDASVLPYFEAMIASSASHGLSLSQIPAIIVSRQNLLWWAIDKNNLQVLQLLLECGPSETLCSKEVLRFVAEMASNEPSFDDSKFKLPSRARQVYDIRKALHDAAPLQKRLAKIMEDWMKSERYARENSTQIAVSDESVAEANAIIADRNFAKAVNHDSFIFRLYPLIYDIFFKHVREENIIIYFGTFFFEPTRDRSVFERSYDVELELLGRQKTKLYDFFEGIKTPCSVDETKRKISIFDQALLATAKGLKTRGFDQDEKYQFGDWMDKPQTLRSFAKTWNLERTLRWLDTDGL